MSEPVTGTVHKRAPSNSAEVSLPKRQLHTPPPTVEALGRSHAPSFKHIYLVTIEESDLDRGTNQHIIGAYVSLQDANWRAVHLQREGSDLGEWEEDYDSYGCVAYSSEDALGECYTINVERLALWNPGSEQEPVELPSSEDEDEEEEEDDGEEDKSENGVLQSGLGSAGIKAAQREAAQRGERATNKCRECGCGDPMCDSCWPQMEEEWALGF